MGIYLNPGQEDYEMIFNSKIFVDKSLLVENTNEILKKANRFVCVSRPRRFGKSTDANMLVAYYSKGCDSHEIFDHLKISKTASYEKHLNKHNVIHLNMQEFLSDSDSVDEMLDMLNNEVLKELEESYGELKSSTNLKKYLKTIYMKYKEPFIFVIDEWDCLFREFKYDKEAQKRYLDYLRNLLKDQSYVALAYMTGILPIKKYGTHSALNMFDEVSMIEPQEYSEFMGFTEKEVKELCDKYQVDFSKMSEWYNGYHLVDNVSIYSPRSVTSAIRIKRFNSYWSQTETFEALQKYIDLNLDGMKDDIITMIAGDEVKVDTSSFQNDMTTFKSKDDVFTLLIHLGYLGYEAIKGTVYIPNNEVKGTFITSIKNSNWGIVTSLFKNANDLLEATWSMDSEKVAKYIQNSHYETSVLQYNDENALSYTISLAYITAKEYYTIVRELPSGKGFADIAFIPKDDKPAMIVELKYDQAVETGMDQIKKKNYPKALEQYHDNLLLVSISYDKTTKEHHCIIEKFQG